MSVAAPVPELPRALSLVDVSECSWSASGFERRAMLVTTRRLDLALRVEPIADAPALVRLSWDEPVDGPGHIDLLPPEAQELGERLLDSAAAAGRGVAIAFAASRIRFAPRNRPVVVALGFAPPDPVLILRLRMGDFDTDARHLAVLPEEAKAIGARLLGAAVLAAEPGEAT